MESTPSLLQGSKSKVVSVLSFKLFFHDPKNVIPHLCISLFNRNNTYKDFMVEINYVFR
jgi:hypothetical protein